MFNDLTEGIKDLGNHHHKYIYYENGQLNREGNYKDGKSEGLVKWYHKNGQLKYERNYKEGEVILQKCWDEKRNEIECE